MMLNSIFFFFRQANILELFIKDVAIRGSSSVTIYGPRLSHIGLIPQMVQTVISKFIGMRVCRGYRKNITVMAELFMHY